MKLMYKNKIITIRCKEYERRRTLASLEMVKMILSLQINSNRRIYIKIYCNVYNESYL